MESFKLKLAAYFTLIALLPLAAAFWAFDAVTERSETRRADAVLQVGVRAALAAYGDELERLERRADRLARDRTLQRALAERDERAVRRALRGRPGLRVEGRGFRVGRSIPLAAERSVTVEGEQGELGTVIAYMPVDARLAGQMRVHTGLGATHQLVFLSGGRVIAGPPGTRGTLEAPVGLPKTISLESERFRALTSAPLPTPTGARLAVLTPQARIDAAVTSAEGHVFAALLIALVLIVLLAYVEGRSIVRTLQGLVDAAHSIAKGKLGGRVPVKGRDEFAQLGRAFNEMADQLQARLGELEEERRRVRDATMRFGEALGATHDAGGLLRVIVETAVEATGAAGGYLEDADGFGLFAGNPEAAGERLRFPVTAGREKFGTLVLVGQRFTDDQCETAGWLVAHAATALANAHRHRTIEKQALVDPLTGLANRRLAESALDKELARAARFEEPVALLMTDLDDFKQINDLYGHPFGDKVLRAFAGALTDAVREIDLAGRWGGEEFAVVLPGTDVEGGAALAERIRDLLRERVVIAADGTPVGITASFGVAAFPAASSKDELVAAADSALYDAKHGGKDRVAQAAPSAYTS